jgi:hypothetical protein
MAITSDGVNGGYFRFPMEALGYVSGIAIGLSKQSPQASQKR